MTRLLYALAWIFATPWVLARLAWRARRQRGYLEHVGERFGRYAPAAGVPRIWIHAVSVGETRAAAPLIEALGARYPSHRILLTHMTPTGRAAGEELFGDRIERAWLPYDYGFAVRRFLEHFRPQFGIILETEIWPRLLEQCARNAIKVALVNARLSERSARRYARAPAFSRWAFGHLAGIAAQTEADKRRFAALGVRSLAVTGNVKFDLAVPGAMVERGAQFRALFGTDRCIWVAGSTREGEERRLLDAFAAQRASAEALMVIVPRHPQRFDQVVALAQARGLATARRSAQAPLGRAVRIVVGDSMGEMLAYYAAADLVLMGGSFLPYGSQNLIEACALGKPVIVGPHTFNFEAAAESAIAAGAAVRVPDAPSALAMASALCADETRRREMGDKARAFVAAHRGAVSRLMAWIEATLAPPEAG